MTHEAGGGAHGAPQQQLQDTCRSLLHLCRSHNRAATEEIEAYARELANNEVERILEVIESAALGQLEVPFALEEGVRVVLSMPRLWGRCIALLLRMMQAEQISGHTAMLLMSEIRMCLVTHYRKLQLSAASFSSSDSAIDELQSICKRALQPFMHRHSKITTGEVLCLEALPSMLRVLAACPSCESVVGQIVDNLLQADWPTSATLPIMSVLAEIGTFIHAGAWKDLMHKLQSLDSHGRDGGDFAGLIRLCFRLAMNSTCRQDDEADAAEDMTTDWLNCARVLYARAPEHEVQTMEILLEQYLLQVPSVVLQLVKLIEASCEPAARHATDCDDIASARAPPPLSWHDIRLMMLLGRSFRIGGSDRLLATSSTRRVSGELDLATFRRRIHDTVCRVLFTSMMTWSDSEFATQPSSADCWKTADMSQSAPRLGGLERMLIKTLGSAVESEAQSSQSSNVPRLTANFATAASCARAELLLQTCIRVVQCDKAVVPNTIQHPLQPLQSTDGSVPAAKTSISQRVVSSAAAMAANEYIVWASTLFSPTSPTRVPAMAETSSCSQTFAREVLIFVYELVPASRAAIVRELYQAAHHVLTGPDQRVGWDKKTVVQSLQLALTSIVNRHDHEESVLKEFQKLLPTLCMLPDPFCSALLVPVCGLCCRAPGGVHQVRQLCRKLLQRPNNTLKLRAIDAMAAILPRVERAAQLDLIQALGFVFTFPVHYRRRLYSGVSAHLLECCFSTATHAVHEDALQLLTTKLDAQLQQYFQPADETVTSDGQLELNVSACFDSTGGEHAEYVLKDDLAGLLTARWLSEILCSRQSARAAFDTCVGYFTKAPNASTRSKRQALPSGGGGMSTTLSAVVHFVETGLADKPDSERLISQPLEWQLAYSMFTGLVFVLAIGCRLFADEQDEPTRQRCVEALTAVQSLTDIILEISQQKRFGRAHEAVSQLAQGTQQTATSLFAGSAGWIELQAWLLKKQVHWLRPLHVQEGPEQYPRSALLGALAHTTWELEQGVVYTREGSPLRLLPVLGSTYESFVAHEVENTVLDLVHKWMCAQPNRQTKRPSRRAVQKVQLRARSAYMEVQQIALSDSDAEGDEKHDVQGAPQDSPLELLPPITWSVGSANAFFQRVITHLPKRVVAGLDRHGVECIRAGDMHPRLVFNVTSNRLRMDMFQLRKQVLDALSSAVNRWCDNVAANSIPLDVSSSASSSSSSASGQRSDVIPMYEYLAREFEKNITHGMPVRLCVSYCDAILSFVRCVREKGVLVLRDESDGAVSLVHHKPTAVVFDVTTGADLRTCNMLFNVIGKYSLPYQNVLRKLLDLVVLLSGNVLAVSKDICKCCLDFAVQQRRKGPQNAGETSSSVLPIVALSSISQCEQVLQHVLRAAESELILSKPQPLPTNELTDFMVMFWKSFRLLDPETTAEPAATNRTKQLVLDLFTLKTQARLLKMFTELLRKCIKEINLMVQLHAVFKRMERAAGDTEEGDSDEVSRQVPADTSSISSEPTGLRILRAVLGHVGIPICNIRRWSKRRTSAHSDEVSHQLGNLLYRAEELELAGARLLRKVYNSEAVRKHARAAAFEAVREIGDMVQALLAQTTQRKSHKRKMGKESTQRTRSTNRRKAGETENADAHVDEDEDDGDDSDRRVAVSATQRQLASRRRVIADEDEDDTDGADQTEGGRSGSETDEGHVASSSDDDDDDDSAMRIQPAPTPARKRSKRLRLRSRHDVIDRWLADEQGDDTYADLEDFIVA